MATKSPQQNMDPDFWKFLSDVIQQYRPPDADPLKAGNELTLSLFSEIQYAVGAPSSLGGPAVQYLPVQVSPVLDERGNPQGCVLILTKRPPVWARALYIVRSGQPDVGPIEVPAGDPPAPITRDLDGRSVIAVKFAEGPNPGDAVRLVSFVTFVPRTYIEVEYDSDEIPDQSAL